MDSVLRPRDIQARIRAGESPEDVAAAAQTSVDRIMGFATPVLAERAYQAELARKASVRRRTALGPVGHLGEALDAHLAPHGLGADDAEWDAWRREDGRWTVVATYLSGAAQETARFTFDPAGRYVVPDNDEARVVVGERSEDAGGLTPASTPAPPSASEAPGFADTTDDADDAEHTGQLALGDDTLDMVLGRGSAIAPSSPSGAPSGGTGDPDWMLTQASDRPEPEPDLLREPEREPEPVPEPEPAPSAPAPAAPAAHQDEPFDALFEAPAARPEPAEEPAASTDEPAPRKPGRSSRGRGRASVPSWDEIMFGTPKDGATEEPGSGSDERS